MGHWSFTKKMKIIKQIVGPYKGLEIDYLACMHMLGDDPKLMPLERKLETKLRKMLLRADKRNRKELYTRAYNEIYDFVQKYRHTNTTQVPNKIGAIKETIRECYRSYIIKIIGKKKKCLEVGCGDGTFSLALALTGNEVVGIDASDTQLNLARNYRELVGLKNVQFLKMNAMKLEFPSNFFDCIISRDLIEHLHPEDAEIHILEVRRVLRSKGMYIIITPNKLSGHQIPLHLNEYNYKDLVELFVKLGYGRIKSTLFHHYYFPCTVLLSPLVKISLEKFTPFFQLSSIIYLSLGLEPICLIAYKN